ncbi:MAG: winged helix-turn-helix domain-containing protein, partial [Myxococcales bacterium]|nr:winged helix-turn-helix domain-containing protein [Myxococcales bacterium]
MSRVLTLADGEVDLDAGRVRRGARQVRLTANEVALLDYLSASVGQAVSREELLRAVWGHRTQVVTRALDQTVSRLRTKLEADSGDPRHLLTVHGVGYVLHLATPPRPEPAHTGLVGREQELDQLASCSARVLSVVGPCGCGKSALVAAATARRTGVRSLPLAEGEDLVGALSIGLGLSLQACRTRSAALERLTYALRSQAIELLVLDDADGALDHPLLPELIEAATSTRFLLTARRSPAFGEVLELGPLPVPAAVTLFVERSGLAATDPQVVEALVRELDLLPSAIELAASRAASLPPARMLERIDALLRILRGRDGSGLREALRWSWEGLSSELASLLARISVFEGPFRVDVAAAVAGEPWDELAALDGLEVLLDHHLVRREPDGRFVVYRVVRRYAEERAPAEVAHARQRHLAHYASRSAAFQDRARPGYRLWDELGAEVAEVVAAHRHAAGGPSEAVLALAVCELSRRQWPIETRTAVLDRASTAPSAPRERANVLL